MYEQIYRTVATIPSGYLASYGQVAAAAGFYRGARLVGWALRALPPDSSLPWHRVINQKGVISIVNPQHPKTQQQLLLEAEGIEICQENGIFRIVNPRWWNFD